MSEKKHTKRIPLTQGKFAIVDAEDFNWLNQFKWCAWQHRNTFYAVNRSKSLYMHREVMGLKKGDNRQPDHIDGNGLNNTKANLRICNSSCQNQYNMSIRPHSSKYKGVTWDKSRQKWFSKITVKRKTINLGRFENEIEAAKAYDKAARKYFDKFARTNFC